ncbi:MAG TPA: hypothetical protein VHS52_09025 [Acidimicrobiales bacterium]|jgi:hypothetical protein|nr:hypothetical protein [Acidimicrobiales bacterium]
MTQSAPSDPGSPLERVLDVALYGPIGLAVAVREGLPRWAEVGRRQLNTRLTMARVVGRLAVDQGSRHGGDIARRLADQADALLGALGLVGEPPDQGADPGPVDTAVVDDVEPSAPDDSHAPPPASAPPAAPAAAQDPAHLAIPGYDTLSASQVVQRLPGLSADELEAVRIYEAAGRARKTILLRAAQLRSGS